LQIPFTTTQPAGQSANAPEVQSEVHEHFQDSITHPLVISSPLCERFGWFVGV